MADFKKLTEIRSNLCGTSAGGGKWQIAVTAVAVMLLVSGVLWIMGAVSCTISDGETITELEEGPPQRSGGGSDASWAYGYNSIEDMCAHSDIIAVGVADRIIETKEESRHLYMTYWDFRIEKMLKGEEAGEITVVQMGSPDVPGSDFDCCPLFLPGDRYLLFLRKNESGSYSFHPQGHFMVWKDRVYSMNYILPEGDTPRPVPGFNPDGVELKTIEEEITGAVDSVHFMFTRYHYRSPGDVMRYDAGMTVDIYANLFTGNNGPVKVTYKVDTQQLPEGITPSIRPAEFDAEPHGEYESILLIIIAPDVAPGTYLIPVEYDFEGAGSGSRTVTLHINDPGLFKKVTNEDLIAHGLPPLGESAE